MNNYYTPTNINNRSTEQQVQDVNRQLSQMINQLIFNQSQLENVRFILQDALNKFKSLSIQPQVQVWRLAFCDLEEKLYSIDFAKALLNYYIQFTECSQIFKSPIFIEVNQLINILLSILLWDKEISDELRHSKGLRAMIRMLRVFPTEELYLALIVASKNIKNSEYMTIKKTQDILIQQYKTTQMRDLISLIIGNMCYSIDQRLLFWCNGFIFQIKPTLQLAVLFMIWKLVYDATEVIEEFLSNNQFSSFFNMLPMSCNCYSEDNAYIIGIIRKLCENNQNYKDRNIEICMNSFTLLLQNGKSNQPKPITQFIYKELFSFFGIIGSKYVQQQLIPIISQIILDNLDDSKVITTGVGCLTNLSTQQQILDNIHNDQSIFKLILVILESFYDKIQLIDYTIKFIINTISNKIAAIQYGQPRIIMKLLFIWHMNPKNISTNQLIIRVFRGLYIINIQYMEIISQCIKEVEKQNSLFNFMNIISIAIEEDLICSKLDNVVETFMLISMIPNLQLKNQLFQNCIMHYVGQMKQKGELKKAIQAVSCLPIEDIGLQF